MSSLASSHKNVTIQEIYQPVYDELETFKGLYHENLLLSDDLIRKVCEHLLKMGGKYLRPAMTLLCASLGDDPKISPKAPTLACAIELIHTATLVHDDIIDESDFRRNQPSIYSKWGREISIIAGDYLYAKAFLMLASIKDTWINEAFSQCAQVMCEGEMSQIEKRSDYEMDESVYFKIIHKKTAALFQASCMGGAYVAGLTPQNVMALGDYGYRLGMAFQIVDDCLDMTSQTAELGKPAGLDFLKNDITLPVIYMLAGMPTSQRSELVDLIGTNIEEASVRVKKAARESGSVQKAMDKAKTFVAEALGNLQQIKDCPAKKSLVSLGDYCLHRLY